MIQRLQQFQRPGVIVVIEHAERREKEMRRQARHRVVGVLVPDERRDARRLQHRPEMADAGEILVGEDLAHLIKA